jgi:hypothetical protein
MPEKLTTVIFDGITRTETIRDLTSEEVAEIAKVQKSFEAQENALQQKAEARTSALAKLAALGLTEEEIAAL